MTEAFAIYDSAGAPVTGASPTWVGVYDAETGDAKTGPAFREVGGGLYAFERPADYDLVGVVDMGGTATPRYGLAIPRGREAFALYASGSPLASATPAWSTLRRVSTGLAVSPTPTIEEIGSGIYVFDKLSADEYVAGVIDGGGSADPRYLYYETARGLKLAPVVGELGAGPGRIGHVVD